MILPTKLKSISLPFLDIHLHRSDTELSYSVYRKPTNKDDLTHYYSHHNPLTKSGIIIGFCLRALRICSPNFLDHEFTYIRNTFLNLMYPPHFIEHAMKKARKIHKRKKTPRPPLRPILVPTNPISLQIAGRLNNSDLRIVTCTSKTNKDLTKSPPTPLPKQSAQDAFTRFLAVHAIMSMSAKQGEI